MEKKLKQIPEWTGFLLFILWLLTMVCVTLMLASQYTNQLVEYMDSVTESAEGSYLEEYCDGTRVSGLPGEGDNMMLMEMYRLSGQTICLAWDYGVPDFLLDWQFTPVDMAVAFYDSEGQLLHTSGNYLQLQYHTEESWTAGKYGIDGWCWVDLDGWTEAPSAPLLLQMWELERIYEENVNVELMRLTGTWDGTRFDPVKIDYVIDAGVGDWQLKDQKGNLDWVSLYDHSASARARGKELVTIYATWPELISYEEPGKITLEDTTYESHVAMLEDIVAKNDQESADALLTKWDTFRWVYKYDEYSLWRVVIFDGYCYPRYDAFSEDTQIPQFYKATVSVAYPLKAAMKALIGVYAGTFLLGLAGLLILNSLLKKKIFSPIEDQMRLDRNEVARLNKALEYAEEAERSRRALVSGVAHELKTPLAVIHGYAEGLKERIAEEKRDRYLDTILSETEKMDALVLEMLDLSRLEAGKVKLARDKLELNELVKTVFGKLEPLAIHKDLKITYDLAEGTAVYGDEGRLSQAVTNLAANAVQYTPAGGWIKVRTFAGKEGVGIAIENKSKPFSLEQLQKVWDSFYRVDASRAGRGTGLGLAIVKSIVELHGGSCGVRNTGDGVEFTISIPGTYL